MFLALSYEFNAINPMRKDCCFRWMFWELNSLSTFKFVQLVSTKLIKPYFFLVQAAAEIVGFLSYVCISSTQVCKKWANKLNNCTK